MKKITLILLSICCLFTTTIIAQDFNEVIKAVATDRTLGDQFGISVAISGDRAIVGALLEAEDAMGGNFQTAAGAAYIFELENNNPPTAVCQDIMVEVDANCMTTITPDQVDGGSSEPRLFKHRFKHSDTHGNRCKWKQQHL